MENEKPLSAQILDLRPHGLRDAKIEALAGAVLNLEIAFSREQRRADEMRERCAMEVERVTDEAARESLVHGRGPGLDGLGVRIVAAIRKL